MARYLLFLVCGMGIFTNGANGQDQKVVDSLNHVLLPLTGGARFPALFEMSFQFLHVDNEMALNFIRQAENAALISGDSLWIVKSRRVKGQILSLLERAEEATEAFNAAMPIADRKEFKMERLFIEFGLGKLDLFLGRYDKALRRFFATLEWSNALEDDEHVAASLTSIGVAYYKLRDYEKGLGYFHKALQAPKLTPFMSSIILTNTALCYVYLGDFQSARDAVEESLELCGVNCSERNIMNIEFVLGLIAQGEVNHSAAERHYLRSYSLAMKTNNTRFQLDNIYLLTEIYIQRNFYERAEHYLKKAERLMADVSMPYNLEIIKIYRRFSELYLKKMNFRKASHYQSKYIELKDSIYNEELTTSLMKTEAEFLERENEARIRAQEEMISVNERMINGQKRLSAVVGLLGIITFIFLLFVWRNYRRKRDFNVMLEEKIKDRTTVLESNTKMLLAKLRERDLRISHASEVITERINTIKGLCITGNREISDPLARTYINKIQSTSNQLVVYLQTFLGYTGLIVDG